MLMYFLLTGRNLTITNISIHDEGLYICESKQPINKAKMNTTIVVQREWLYNISFLFFFIYLYILFKSLLWKRNDSAAKMLK